MTNVQDAEDDQRTLARAQQALLEAEQRLRDAASGGCDVELCADRLAWLRELLCAIRLSRPTNGA